MWITWDPLSEILVYLFFEGPIHSYVPQAFQVLSNQVRVEFHTVGEYAMLVEMCVQNTCTPGILSNFCGLEYILKVQGEI